ncbi:MAG TPA: UDP-N-acetylmuramate--L-alanine ligase [Terriglobales bacterium]|nr:UDP-N-acetylmuramate--L-alanine ligase [Terriglobales bacterium]
MFARIQRVHFVGIGGIGMSGIAEVLLNLGYRISGSDLKRSLVTDRLKTMGAVVFEGHAPENVTGADVVVISSAVTMSNPEVIEAKRLHTPVIQRAEMLAELMRLKYGIAIAGMHGKTTTTSMVAAVLAAGGLDPTVVVGGRVDAMGSNARLGRSQYLVAEADESDRSFLRLSPILAVVTNIDREHMDCYRNMQDVKRTFLEFMDRVPFYGMVVVCNDDPVLRRLFPKIPRRMVSYGTRKGSDFLITLRGTCGPGRARPGGSAGHSRPAGADEGVRPYTHTIENNTPAGTPLPPLSCFEVSYRGKELGEFRLHVPGVHNVLNATAAIAVGIGLDIPVAQIREALEHFRGVDRRFQLRGTEGGVAVIDDYGHHPTEIRATLAAARDCGYRKIHVIFQPHRYTRTRDLMDEFATAFSDADSLFVLDIYPASEQPIEGITGEALARRISEEATPGARYVESFEEAASGATAVARPGDMILTLGAGSVSLLGPMVLEKLKMVLATQQQ